MSEPSQTEPTASQAEPLTNTQSSIQSPTPRMLLAHRLALIGYWGLILLIPLWNLWWFPPTNFSGKGVTLFLLIPLIFPMKGLHQGKAYTHAWSGFIAVIYVCHGLTALFLSMEEIIPVMLELIFSSLFLFGGMYYARWRGIQLGLELPKKK